MSVGNRIPSIGLMPRLAIYMLMLVFVGRLANLHPVFSFRGLGFLTVCFSICAAITAERKQSLWEIHQLSPLFKYVVFFIAMVYISIPFSVWVSGSVQKSIAFLYVVAFFGLLLILAKGEAGLKALLGSGLTVFTLLSIMLVKNYGEGRISIYQFSYDPNDIAYVLTSLLPLMYYFMQTIKNNFLKIIGYGSVLLSIIAIALTQSRGAMLSFIAVILMFLRFEKTSFKFILAGIFLGIIAMFFLPDTFWERMSTLTDIQSDYNFTSDAGRLAIWENGLELFRSNPLTGVGVGQFSVAQGIEDDQYMTAHNAVIQIGTELGIVGLVCYLFMTLGPLKRLKQRNDNPAMTLRIHYPLYRGLYISFFGQFVGSMFLSVGYFFNMFYLLAVFFILNTIDELRDNEEFNETVIVGDSGTS